MEPETLINEMSVVLVDEHGDFIRRPIGGPKGIDAVTREVGVPVYDVEETVYHSACAKNWSETASSVNARNKQNAAPDLSAANNHKHGVYSPAIPSSTAISVRTGAPVARAGV